MEQEILDDRESARQEQVQRARDYLKARNLSWLINYLLEHGPQTEHALMLEGMDQEYHLGDAVERACGILCELNSLWLVRKVWKLKLGVHPGSGEDYHLYGLKGVHPDQNKKAR